MADLAEFKLRVTDRDEALRLQTEEVARLSQLLASKTDELNNRAQISTNEVFDLKGKLVELGHTKLSDDAKIKRVEEQVTDLRTQLENEGKAVASNKELINEKNVMIDGLNKRLEKYENQYEEMNELNQKLRTSTATGADVKYWKDISVLKENLRQRAEETKDAAVEDRARLEEKLQAFLNIENDMLTLKSEKQRLESDGQAKDQKVRDLEKNIGVTNSKLDQQTTLANTYLEAKSNLGIEHQQALANHQIAVEKLKGEHQATIARLETRLQDKNTELETRTRAFEGKKQTLNAHLNEVKSDLEQSRENVTTVRANLETALAAADGLRNDIQVREGEIAKLKTDLDSMTAERDNTKKELDKFLSTEPYLKAQQEAANNLSDFYRQRYQDERGKAISLSDTLGNYQKIFFYYGQKVEDYEAFLKPGAALHVDRSLQAPLDYTLENLRASIRKNHVTYQHEPSLVNGLKFWIDCFENVNAFDLPKVVGYLTNITESETEGLRDSRFFLTTVQHVMDDPMNQYRSQFQLGLLQALQVLYDSGARSLRATIGSRFNDLVGYQGIRKLVDNNVPPGTTLDCMILAWESDLMHSVLQIERFPKGKLINNQLNILQDAAKSHVLDLSNVDKKRLMVVNLGEQEERFVVYVDSSSYEILDFSKIRLQVQVGHWLIQFPRKQMKVTQEFEVKMTPQNLIKVSNILVGIPVTIK